MRDKSIVLFFDTETSGLTGAEVLSFSYIKVRFRSDKNERGNRVIKYSTIETGSRYYYSKREPEKKAIEINGLTNEVIKDKRGNCNYPIHFKDDDEILNKILADVDGIVAHNLQFDEQFLPIKMENKYCTMMNSIDLCKIPNPYFRKGKNYGRYKWTKNLELAQFFNTHIDESKLHLSDYDIEITYKNFISMFKRKECYEGIIKFLFGED